MQSRDGWTRLSALAPMMFLVVACTTTEYGQMSLADTSADFTASQPDWLAGDSQRDPERIYFVGRGLAHTALEERNAYDEAVDHAHQQLARHVMSRVLSEVNSGSDRAGAPYLWPGGSSARVIGKKGSERDAQAAGEAHNAWRERELHVLAEVITGYLVPEREHWAEWKLSRQETVLFGEETHFNRHFKVWVLMSIGLDQVEDLVKRTEAVLMNEEALAESEAAGAQTREEVERLQSELSRREALYDELAELLRCGPRYEVVVR